MKPEDDYSALDDYQSEYSALDGYKSAKPEPKKGIVNDTLVSLGKGVMQLPAVATGAVDIVGGLAGMDRPMSKAADIVGEQTGFQPSKWAKEADKDYSQQTQEASQNVDDAWNNPNTNGFDVAKAYIQNPRAIAKTVVESLPSMVAGNAIGVGAKALGLTASVPVASGIGEGVIMAGQAMDNIDKSVDPRTAALAATAIGVGGGIIGTQSGKIANRLGLPDPDQAFISAGEQGIGDAAMPMWKRVVGGAITEGPIEEGIQSALETGAQNYAEDKPITEGMARNVVEGSIAGAAMGGPMGILSKGQEPVIDPSQASNVETSTEPQGTLARAAAAAQTTSTVTPAVTPNTNLDESQVEPGLQTDATNIARGSNPVIDEENNGVSTQGPAVEFSPMPANIDPETGEVLERPPLTKKEIRAEAKKVKDSAQDLRTAIAEDGSEVNEHDFLMNEIRKNKRTYEEARQEFNNLFPEKPKEEIINDEKRTGTASAVDAAKHGSDAGADGIAINDGADTVAGKQLDDGTTSDQSGRYDGSGTSGGLGGYADQLPGQSPGNDDGQTLRDPGELSDVELEQDKETLNAQEEKPLSVPENSEVVDPPESTAALDLPQEKTLVESPSGNNEIKQNDKETISEQPKTDDALDEPQPAFGSPNAELNDNYSSKTLSAHQEELAKIEKQEAYIRDNKVGDSFNSYQKKELQKIKQKRKELTNAINELQSSSTSPVSTETQPLQEIQNGREEKSTIENTANAGQETERLLKPEDFDHLSSEGFPLKKISDNLYQDHLGGEVEDDYARKAKPEEIQSAINDVQKANKTDTAAQPEAQGANPLAPGSNAVVAEKEAVDTGTVAENKITTETTQEKPNVQSQNTTTINTENEKDQGQEEQEVKPEKLSKSEEDHLFGTQQKTEGKLKRAIGKAKNDLKKHQGTLEEKLVLKQKVKDAEKSLHDFRLNYFDQQNNQDATNDTESKTQPILPNTGANTEGNAVLTEGSTGTAEVGAGEQTQKVTPERVGTPNGKPFSSEKAANAAIKSKNGYSPITHDVIEDENNKGKFWIQKNETGAKVDILSSSLDKGHMVNVRFKSPDRLEKMEVMDKPFTPTGGEPSVKVRNTDGRAWQVIIPLHRVSLVGDNKENSEKVNNATDKENLTVQNENKRKEYYKTSLEKALPVQRVESENKYAIKNGGIKISKMTPVVINDVVYYAAEERDPGRKDQAYVLYDAYDTPVHSAVNTDGKNVSIKTDFKSLKEFKDHLGKLNGYNLKDQYYFDNEIKEPIKQQSNTQAAETGESITNSIANDKEKTGVSNSNKFTQDELNRNRYFTPTPGVTITALSGRKYDGLYVGHISSTGESTHQISSMEGAYEEALKLVELRSNTQPAETKASSGNSEPKSSNDQAKVSQKAIADRLESLVNKLQVTESKSAAYKAKQTVESIIIRLRKGSNSADEIVPVLKRASDDLYSNGYAPASEVIDEVIEQLSGKQTDVSTKGEKADSTGAIKESELRRFTNNSKEAERMSQLKSDMGQAIGEALSILGGKMNMTPEEETKILPVMSKIFRIAAEMGYLKFKDASRYVMQQFRELGSKDIVDKIEIDNLRGAFINSGGNWKEVGAYETMKDLESDNSPFENEVTDNVSESATQEPEKTETPEAEQQEPAAETKSSGDELATLNQALNDAEDEYAKQGMIKNAHTRKRIENIKKQIANIEHPELLKALDGNVDLVKRLVTVISFEAQDGWNHDLAKEKRLWDKIYNSLVDRGTTEDHSARYANRVIKELKFSLETKERIADGKYVKTKNNTSAPSKEGVSLESGNNEVEKNDEHPGNGSDSKGVLEGSVPGTLSSNGGKRPAQSRSGSRSGANKAGNGSAKNSRSDGTGGMGGSEGIIPSEEAGRLLDQQLEKDLVGDDFVIDDNELGHGTYGERLANNMAAIRLVKQLEQEGRKPTQAEKEILAQFAGWGALKNVFNPFSKAKQDRVALKELESILDENELFWAKQGVLAQHFTSPEVVTGIYDTLNHLGYTGGNALEPTVGVGNFIGAMPLTMKGATSWYASEIDPIPGKIAQYLYPESTILTGTGFQKAEFPYNKFDLVIGNPPFGDERITDKNPARKAINHFKIHNYIIAKSAMHLKPGGVMAFVVTNRFLDTKDSEARAFLAENFNLLAAVRLPNNAFKKNAGTEVTTDIVFLQKRLPGQAEGNTDWLNTQGSMTNVDGEQVTLNEYFANHPEMMLGKPSMNGTMNARGGEDRKEFTLEPHEGKTIAEQMQGLLDGPLADMKGLLQSEHNEIMDAQSTAIQMNRDDVAIGGFFMEGDSVFMRNDDDESGNAKFEKLTPATQWTEKSTLGVTRYNRIKGMLVLRASAYNLVDAERADSKDIDSLRKTLNERYDEFVKNYGYINSTANAGLMAGDIKIEFGLEKNYKKAITAAKSKSSGFEQAKESADKADILKERVFYPYKEILAAANPRDGYAISLSEKGVFDAGYIAGLTGLSTDEVTNELSTGSDPLIYKDPATGEWVQEDEYLSGNVKKKLKEAKGLHGYEKNVEALTKILPKDVTQEEVFANIGQTWIPESVYSQFMDELGVSGARVAIDNYAGSVTVTGSHSITPSAIGKGFENRDYSLPELFNLIANRKAVVAYDYDENRNRSVNQERTKELQIIARRMTAFFKDWIFADTMRAEDLVKLYNDTQNTTVERKSEAKNLRTVGANPSFELRDTQKSAAWRMIQAQSVLLDHIVGSGKTATIITGIMERKRMGLSKKPMLVVPNHIVSQWAKEFVELYPGANLLIASEKDFQKQNRRRLFARIATGKYDAIIIGHSSFKFIAVAPETEQQFIRDELKLLEDALLTAVDNEDKRAVRTIRNRIAKRMERLNKLNSAPKDDVVSFDQMGIDYLAIDESHQFKNLEYATGMQRVSGMGTPNGSQRAFDLYMKLRTLLDRDNGGVTFATGTPISNSLVEMYTIMRYLNKQGLIDRNIESFDAWAKNYANVEPAIEYTATGKLKERTIMGTFNNVPEMMQLYKEFADVVTMNDLKRIYSEQVARSNKEKGENNRTEFPVPKVASGGRQLIKAQPSAEQLEYMDYLIERTLQVEEDMKTKGFDPTKDNLLWIYNDAKKAALDVRLVDPSAPDNPGSKVNKAVDNIVSLYHKWHDDKGTQLVFIDMSTPGKSSVKDANDLLNTIYKRLKIKEGSTEDKTIKVLDTYKEKWNYLQFKLNELLEDENISEDDIESLQSFIDETTAESEVFSTADSGFSVYDDIKTKLIGQGMPANEVQFIHDYKTALQKQELFALVNSGKVRVLLGSTAKMGAGTNAQERMVGLHHIDSSQHNRPSDIEQREGRIIRQGNKLYMRDPDGFEVEIKAYSTEKTFDAVSWQTLGKKARMLDSFRSGERTVEESQSDTASYLEFMAETTGNPIFREKIRLEGEISELETDERRLGAQLSAANRTIANAEGDARTLENRVKQVKDALDDLGKGDTFSFNGETFKNDYDKVFRAEWQKYEDAKKPYNLALQEYALVRAEYDKAEKGNRGKAPAKPKEPEYPYYFTDAMQAKSEAARFIKKLAESIKAFERDGDSLQFKVGDLSIDVELTIGKNSNEKHTGIYDKYGLAGFEITPAQTDHIINLINKFSKKTYNEVLENREDRAKKQSEQVKIAKEFVANNKFTGAEELAAKKARYEEVKTEVDNIEAVEAERRSQNENKYVKGDVSRFSSGTTRGMIEARNAKEQASEVKFSKATASKSGSTVADIKSLLPSRVNKMIKSGNLKIVQSADSVLGAQSFDAGGVEGLYNPSSDTLYLIADNITKSNVNSVIYHELFHRSLATDQKLKEAVNSFTGSMQERFNLAVDGKASPIENMAAKRVINADTPTEDQIEEFMAYQITEWNKNPESFTGAIKKIIQNFIAAIRMALLRAGIAPSSLTPADLNALAKQGAKVNQGSAKDTLGVKSKLKEIRQKISDYEAFIKCLAA